MIHFRLCVLLMLSSTTGVISADNSSAAFIQRTMVQLAESTERSPASVRVMFYGQSITAQPWTDIVEQNLRQQYPSVQFEFTNPAIGSFRSDRLIRTAEHDLYPWYPDLLIFHVYGPMDSYEKIIRSVRERTTAEIVLHTDHITCQPDDKQTEQDLRVGQITEIARRYDCMAIDVRSKWRAYLAETGKHPKTLLRDDTHLNEDGCALLAKLISEELIRVPNLGDGTTPFARIVPVEKNSPEVAMGEDGSISLSFYGNRVVGISDGSGNHGAFAEVLLDGRPVETFREMWAATRPSNAPHGSWMPAIKQVGFNTVPVAQEWTASMLPDSAPDGSRLHFNVSGSVTGFDGSGWSEQTFVSTSKQVVIQPKDWWIAWVLNLQKKELPEAFSVKWRTYPLCARKLESKPEGSRTVLVQGCVNTEHTLTLVPENGKIGVGQFLIYSPATNFPAIGQ